MIFKPFTAFHKRRSRFPEMRMMPFILIGLIFLILSWASVRFYLKTFTPIINIPGHEERFLFVPTGGTLKTIVDSLDKHRWLRSKNDFIWLANRNHLNIQVHPGRYRIKDGMTNHSLVKMLRTGRQEPLNVTIHNVRTPGELAGKLSKKIEPDSAGLMALFKDARYLERYKITPQTLFVIIIPNTYNLYWNTTGVQLLDKLHQEYRKFWNEDRCRLADSLKMTIPQVVIMASIVEKESNKDSEKPDIAGVYINRLRKGMLLQADPTVIFAWQDFTIRRVVKKHIELNNPYNTYIYAGLPPGPICLPSISSIDAVLKARRHQYLYFCARGDRSGLHNFAVTLAEHQQNARKFQTTLNRLNIR